MVWPMVTLPLRTTGLRTVRAVVSLRMVVPSAIVSVPVPSGPVPVTKVKPAVVVGAVTELPAPRMIEPALSVTPPLKVLAPVSTKEPAPAFVRLAAVPLMVFWITPVIERSTGERPEVVIVLAPPLSSQMALSVGV